MSISHDLAVLELESQIDVLSRIQFVSRFGSNLVHIEGVKGSGKSWLAQRYLEHWSNDTNQVLLMCHSSQSIQQQRGIILKQVVQYPLFNEFDTLIDSIERMLAGEKCNLVLVIDDAHLLPPELLSELWLLVQKAQSMPNWQINVLLFSEAGKLAPALSRVSYGQDNKPVNIDIAPLSEEEAATFSEMLVVRFAPSREDKVRIRNLVDNTPRLPAELIALGEKKKERRVIIRSVTQSPVRILGLASILLLSAVGGYWWLGQSAKPISSVLDATLEQDENLALGVDDKLDYVGINEPEDDTHTIPPDVIDTPVVIETTIEEGKRVVVPSELVDSLVSESELTQGTQEEPTQISNEIIKPNHTAADEVSSKNEASKDESIPTTTFALANEELAAISDKRYLLQLAALTNKEAAQEFLEEHQIEGSARIYQALRNGSIWYIVTFGDYASISAARNAVQTLPNTVQTLGPWAKSLVQVHREIDSVK